MCKYIHSRTRIRTPLYKRYTVAYSRAYAYVCLFESVYIYARSFFLQKNAKTFSESPFFSSELCVIFLAYRRQSNKLTNDFCKIWPLSSVKNELVISLQIQLKQDPHAHSPACSAMLWPLKVWITNSQRIKYPQYDQIKKQSRYKNLS